jgi:hypothetical protein
MKRFLGRLFLLGLILLEVFIDEILCGWTYLLPWVTSDLLIVIVISFLNYILIRTVLKYKKFLSLIIAFSIALFICLS